MMQLPRRRPERALEDVDGARDACGALGKLEERRPTPCPHHPRVAVARVKGERVSVGLDNAHLMLH